MTPVQEPGQSPGFFPSARHDDGIPSPHQRNHREPAPPGTFEPPCPDGPRSTLDRQIHTLPPQLVHHGIEEAGLVPLAGITLMLVLHQAAE